MCHYCLRAATQCQTTYWTTPEPGNPLHYAVADTKSGAKLLVRRLQPRGDVDSVAVCRVVKELPAAEIAHQRRPGMNTDTCRADQHTLLPPACPKCLD